MLVYLFFSSKIEISIYKPISHYRIECSQTFNCYVLCQLNTNHLIFVQDSLNTKLRVIDSIHFAFPFHDLFQKIYTYI